MYKKEILEKAYFHIDNSGITIKLWRDNGVAKDEFPTYFMDVSLNSFGYELKTTIHLVSRGMITWLVDALNRVKSEMGKTGTSSYLTEEEFKPEIIVKERLKKV